MGVFENIAPSLDVSNSVWVWYESVCHVEFVSFKMFGDCNVGLMWVCGCVCGSSWADTATHQGMQIAPPTLPYYIFEFSCVLFLSYVEKSFLWDWMFLSGGTIVWLGYSRALKTLANTIVLSVFVFHWHWTCVLYISLCIFSLSHFRMQVTQCGRPSYALIWTFWIPLPTFRHT